jgi:CTP:molybdopterin cytidylyltransferase MocA
MLLNEITPLGQFALIVLAAGRSTRMGKPKALVELDGRPLLAHLLALPLVRQFGEVLVVLGHHAEWLRPVVEACSCRHVINPEPDRGRTSSVQIGLRALSSELRGAFVQPVDCPLILPATYQTLGDCFQASYLSPPTPLPQRESGVLKRPFGQAVQPLRQAAQPPIRAIGPADVIIPCYLGKHGHPPLVSAAIFPPILSAGADAPLRELLQGPGIRRQIVAVNDPGILLNLNSPEDLAGLDEVYAEYRRLL